MNNSNFKQVIVIAMLLIGQTIVAQTLQTSEQQNKQAKTSVVPIKDLNANGIDDAKEKLRLSKKQGVRMHDKFIDANGDGICDNREQGLGFSHGKGQSTNQSGKRQQGRHK